MKNFRLILISKVLLIALFIFGGFYLYYSTGNFLFIAVSDCIAIYLIISIIRHVDKTNRELTRFITSIKYSDFSQSFSDTQAGNSFKDLYRSFNEVMEKFREERNEKEEQYRYLQTVLRHVGVGLISFDAHGKVEFINHAAQKLLGSSRIINIESLNKAYDMLGSKITNLRPGEKATIKLYDEEDIIQLVVHTTEFKMRNNVYKLVSLQNIQSELEEKEFEAWQKLIRVLTHEIMNSVTPISSLASTVNVLLHNGNHDQLTDEDFEDVKNAVNTIQKRSEGLIEFVENYRNLTKIPKPDFEIISIHQLFHRIEHLLANDFRKKSIKFSSSIEPATLELTADQNLIEQILINLIINSMQALSDCSDKKIELNAQLNAHGRVIIRVIDNGIGIPEEIQEKIFIPFFSTKNNGSGIGLSLARQVMRAHRGNLRVSSVPGKKTVFTLSF